MKAAFIVSFFSLIPSSMLLCVWIRVAAVAASKKKIYDPRYEVISFSMFAFN